MKKQEGKMKKSITAFAFMMMTSALFAGATDGPQSANTSVKANGTDRFEVSFAGGEMAQVTVNGDGDTDLDLYIYDANGNLVAKDEGDTDRCSCRWYPRWDGKYTIKVVNRGNVYNVYSIRTN